jgi:hypothetical protein
LRSVDVRMRRLKATDRPTDQPGGISWVNELRSEAPVYHRNNRNIGI